MSIDTDDPYDGISDERLRRIIVQLEERADRDRIIAHDSTKRWELARAELKRRTTAKKAERTAGKTAPDITTGT